MTKVFGIFYLVTISALLLNKNATLGIIGGHPVHPLYPFFVEVQSVHLSCGATIVAQDAVVTAAHCLFVAQYNRWARYEEVRIIRSDFTKPNWRSEGTWYSCERYAYHKYYDVKLNDGFVPFDIALITLTELFHITSPGKEMLKPCPYSMNFREGYSMGMGLTNRSPDRSPDVLMGVTLMPYLPCAKYFKSYGVFIHEHTQVCYGNFDPDTYAGTCDGDSGGPLVFRDIFNRSLCLIGVNSFNFKNCNDPRFPSVFYQDKLFQQMVGRYPHRTSFGSPHRSPGKNLNP